MGAINGTIAVGGTTGFTFTDSTGKTVTETGVSYSVTSSNASTAFFNNGVFTATAAGTYTIQAAVGGQNYTTTVTVSGQAAGITLNTASASLVANGASTDVITVKAVDSNGALVPNFNGSVTLAIPAAGGTLANTTVNLTNGVGTVTLTAPAANPGTSETVTSSALTSPTSGISSSVNYGTLSLSYTTASVSALKLTPTLATVSDNTSSADAITVNLVDSTGNPVTGASSVYATFTLTGPGSFQQGGSPVTTLSQYVSDGSTINVYSVQGQSGSIGLSAAATGLTNGSTTVSSTTTQAASAIKLTSTQGTLSAATTVNTVSLPIGTAFTLYTVQVTDANGNPVPKADTITIADNTYNASNSPVDPVEYFSVTSGQPNAALTDTNGVWSGLTTSATTGSVQFIAINSATQSTPATLTVKDTTLNASTTGSYSFSTGSAVQVAPVAATTVNQQAGTSATYSVQLEDTAGNPVAQSGVSVDFYFDTNAATATINNSTGYVSGNPYVVQTNSQGQASVTVAIPSAGTGTFVLDSSISGETAGNITTNAITATVTTAAATTTQLAFTTTTGGATAATVPSTLNAGGTFGGASLFVTPENAIGGYTGAPDSIKITSSNPKVLSIAGATNGSITQQSSLVVPTVTGDLAGTATLTISDVTNPSVPSLTESVTVSAGAPTQVQGVNPDGTTDKAYTFSATGVSSAFTLQLVDAGGNVVPTTSPITLTKAEVLTALGASGVASGVRTSATGADVSSVTIPANQASVTVYLDGVTANGATSAAANTALTAVAPNLLSASLTGSTLTLTFDNPVESSVVLATQELAYTVSDTTTPANITGVSNVVISGDTVTLTLTGPGAAHLDAVTVAYATTGGLQSGYTAPVAAITATAVTNNN